MSRTISTTTATAILAVLAVEGVAATEDDLKTALFSLIAGEPVTAGPNGPAELQEGEFFLIHDDRRDNFYGRGGDINTTERLEAELSDLFTERKNDGYDVDDISDDWRVFIARREVRLNIQERPPLFERS